MSQIEIVATSDYAMHRLALLRGDEVWVVFVRPWWDVASWVRWFAMPGRMEWVLLRRAEGRVRVRAKCVARKHVRLGGEARRTG